jgi:exopolyphosphatase/guanosine-5'-triphosphate,3'-diphosphate pyrophosphatase
MTPGSLVVRIDDRQIVIHVVGGATHVLPVGPCSLVDGPLEGADPPPPANLTNALGLVHDHLDDLLIEAPSIGAATTIVLTGRHAEALTCVEIGTQECPDRYELERSAADEVFRTIVGERADDRRHNPGLPDDQVDTIIGTCCVVLGIMRRLDRGSLVVERCAAEEDGH